MLEGERAWVALPPRRAEEDEEDVFIVLLGVDVPPVEVSLVRLVDCSRLRYDVEVFRGWRPSTRTTSPRFE